MARKVMVVGGTGMLGRPVAKRLHEDGYAVTVMSSHPQKAREKSGMNLPLVKGDVTNKDSLRRAMEGHQLVHLNLSAHLEPELYKQIEIDGTANVAEVAKEFDMERVSCISSATSHGVIEGPIYLSGKVRAEQALMSSGVNYTIMRPSWFFESLPLFVQNGRAVIIGRQPNKLRWLAASDYAAQVSKAMSTKEAINRCFYSLGPRPMTMMEALTLYCEGRHPGLRPETIPFKAARELSEMPGMEKLRIFIPFMEFFNDYQEDADPTEADRLLGANETTLTEWLVEDCSK